MPYKFETEHKTIPKDKDRRIKLSDDQKIEICQLYDTGSFSQRKLATMFKVSRRTIQFVLNPEKQKENYQRRVERGGSKLYYTKERNRAYKKSHRDYKKELNKNGELNEKCDRD